MFIGHEIQIKLISSFGEIINKTNNVLLKGAETSGLNEEK